MAVPYAFATLVSSDSYLPGALALAGALNDIHPSPVLTPEVHFQTVCLVTPETVDVSTIKLLRRAFNIVVGVEVIGQDDDKGLKLLGRPDLNTVLTKLHVFRLTQFSKVIFLDADVLPIRPLSHLFTLSHEFSAVPDVGWPDIFNSGVLVLSPGEDKFTQLSQLLKSKGSWDGGDQGLLNEWRGGDWNRLSFTYNTTPTAAYTYAPAYERFGSQISAIHFIGPNKPWSSISYRTPFSSQPTPAADSNQQAYDYNSLVDRWFAVYDKHYRSEALAPQSQFNFQRYTSAWDETKTGAELSSVPMPTGSTLGLEDLRRLAIEGMSTSRGGSSDDRSGEGEYTSMPLEGRLDLMRPKKAASSDGPVQERVQERVQEQVQERAQEQVQEQAQEQQERAREQTQEQRSGKQKEKPMPMDLLDPEGPPQTPIAQQVPLQNEVWWQTLSTPDPQDIPSSPRPKIISLPSTPTPQHVLHQYYNQPPADDAVQQKTPPQHDKLYQSQAQQEQEHHEESPSLPEQQPQSQSYHLPKQHQHQQHGKAPRPHSPPMLVWNAAVDPPPTATPISSAFPSDTYFPNIWDQTPSKQNDQPHHGSSPIPDSGGFFEPPPPSEIPEPLLRQGHYRNVTGDDLLGASPSPDRTKVKHVFPWEEKPRQLPGRVFPATDTPTPSLFLSPDNQTSPEVSSEVPSTPENRPIHTHALSPLYGLPSTLTYTNAWDTVPSIQKYASRLVRPAHTPRPLAPPFDEDGWQKGANKNWHEKAEASSRDGDDEDSDEQPPSGSIWDDDSDQESAKSASEQRRSRRGSSVSATRTIVEKKKAYRAFGVQTLSPEMRSQGVQVSVEPLKIEKIPDHEKKLTMSSKRHWAPSSRSSVLPPITMHEVSTGPDISMVTDVPGPVSDLQHPPLPPLSPLPRSPSTSSPVLALSRPIAKTTASPIQPAIRTSRSPSVVTRQVSNDSSFGSPASSIGPLSPPDGQPISSPLRKAGRVWDPARGVELFKRGSEEVLARFLKMGSWDDENR